MFSALVVLPTKLGAHFDSLNLLEHPTEMFIFYLSTVEFSVEKIQDIEWNEEAFSNLVIPHDHKFLLQSLVQAHHDEIDFDDLIKGKGHGLVVNLFGPSGVGE